MRGDRVVVRGDGGSVLTARVWEAKDSVIYVTSAANLDRLARGEPAPMPIGFPTADVFSWSPDALAIARSGQWGVLSEWAVSIRNTRSNDAPTEA